MTEHRLRETLKELQARLQDPGSVDEEGRELLRALAGDIQRFLDQESEAGGPHSLRERLEEGLEDFEGSHPKLAATLGSVIEILRKMGF